MDTDSVWRRQEVRETDSHRPDQSRPPARPHLRPLTSLCPRQDTQADFEGLQSSSEDGDYTSDPYPAESAPLPMAGRKARKGRMAGVPSKSKESKKAPGTPR